MVYAYGLEPYGATLGGSSPLLGTFYQAFTAGRFSSQKETGEKAVEKADKIYKIVNQSN